MGKYALVQKLSYSITFSNLSLGPLESNENCCCNFWKMYTNYFLLKYIIAVKWTIVFREMVLQVIMEGK